MEDTQPTSLLGSLTTLIISGTIHQHGHTLTCINTPALDKLLQQYAEQFNHTGSLTPHTIFAGIYGLVTHFWIFPRARHAATEFITQLNWGDDMGETVTRHLNQTQFTVSTTNQGSLGEVRSGTNSISIMPFTVAQTLAGTLNAVLPPHTPNRTLAFIQQFITNYPKMLEYTIVHEASHTFLDLLVNRITTLEEFRGVDTTNPMFRNELTHNILAMYFYKNPFPLKFQQALEFHKSYSYGRELDTLSMVAEQMAETVTSAWVEQNTDLPPFVKQYLQIDHQQHKEIAQLVTVLAQKGISLDQINGLLLNQINSLKTSQNQQEHTKYNTLAKALSNILQNQTASWGSAFPQEIGTLVDFFNLFATPEQIRNLMNECTLGHLPQMYTSLYPKK